MRVKAITGLYYGTYLGMFTCLNCGCHILFWRNEMQNCKQQTQNSQFFKHMVVGFVLLFPFITAHIIAGITLCSHHARIPGSFGWILVFQFSSMRLPDCWDDYLCVLRCVLQNAQSWLCGGWIGKGEWLEMRGWLGVHRNFPSKR